MKAFAAVVFASYSCLNFTTNSEDATSKDQKENRLESKAKVKLSICRVTKQKMEGRARWGLALLQDPGLSAGRQWRTCAEVDKISQTAYGVYGFSCDLLASALGSLSSIQKN